MAQLTGFQLTNAKLQNGTFTATVNYQMTFGNFDTISNTQLRIFWYDNITNSYTDYPISNNIGTISISKIISGPYISVSGQCLALPSTLSGNVLQGGTYYPVAMAPSPPSLSSGTYNPPQPDGSNFYLTTITSSGTATISITVKKPGDASFGFFLDHIPLSPNGIIPFKLPFSANPTLYGTYSFQAQAFDSTGAGSQLSNIATITVNSPLSPPSTAIISLSNGTITYQNGTVTATANYVLNDNTWKGQTVNTKLNILAGGNIFNTGTSQITLQSSGTITASASSGLSSLEADLIIQNLSNQALSNTLTQYATTPLPQPTPPTTQNNAIDIRASNNNVSTFIISSSDMSQLNTFLVTQPPGYGTITQNNIVTNPTNATFATVKAFLDTNYVQTYNPKTSDVTISVKNAGVLNGTVSLVVPFIINNSQVNGRAAKLQTQLQQTDSNGLVIGQDTFNFILGSTSQDTVQIPNVSGGNQTIFYKLFLIDVATNQPLSLPVTGTISPTTPPVGVTPAIAINIQTKCGNVRWVYQNPNDTLGIFATVQLLSIGSSVSIQTSGFKAASTVTDWSKVPQTLNGIYQGTAQESDNTVSVASSIIACYSTVTPPPPTGPKRSLIDIAGGIFAGLLTLSLITGGSLKKGKR